ncbi:MAG: hypothetical protein M3Z05_13170, partial [Gemmatimonadota bacterium]|nr:hypothetical protein [Gemmatimonadota bacterium]
FGPLIIYGGVIVLLLNTDVVVLTNIAHMMTTALTGTYGLRAALTGNIEEVEVAGRVVTALQRWLGATLIWGAASAALLYLVASRRMNTV